MLQGKRDRRETGGMGYELNTDICHSRKFLVKDNVFHLRESLIEAFGDDIYFSFQEN